MSIKESSEKVVTAGQLADELTTFVTEHRQEIDIAEAGEVSLLISRAAELKAGEGQDMTTVELSAAIVEDIRNVIHSLIAHEEK